VIVHLTTDDYKKYDGGSYWEFEDGEMTRAMVMRISEASQVLDRPSQKRDISGSLRAICHLSNVCLLMAWSLRPFANRVPNEAHDVCNRLLQGLL
jgi:hypothetical protein